MFFLQIIFVIEFTFKLTNIYGNRKKILFRS